MAAAVLVIVAVGAAGQTPQASQVEQTSSSQRTPGELKIQWGRNSIHTAPEKFQGYNQLALGLIRRARETADTGCYTEAEQAVKKSVELAPDNFEARKAEIEILLGRQDFAPALAKARALNLKAPDDVQLWGYLAEANIGLGDYPEAEKAAQWMLDLRPGNVPGLIEGAALRKLYGDIDGARDFLNQAYQQTPPNEFEEAAWLLTEMADLERGSGRLDRAEKLLAEAQGIFPGYYRALEGQARVRMARREYVEAVELLSRRNQSFPTLGSEYALAAALTQAGRTSEAAALYARFEREARGRMENADNANRELILYYVDQAHQPAEALRIARLEATRRHDVLTLDAFAWALYANAQYTEAQNQMNRALAVGIQDGQLFYHAGQIASKLGFRAQAAQYFKQAHDLGALPEELKAVGEIPAGVETAASRGASPK
ncbi:MAG TPA: tetratricopeptide repeat protein [Terriglobia bacterium]|nr:tetratricopeptide repeat protein [Terriglobia bacterium]